MKLIFPDKISDLLYLTLHRIILLYFCFYRSDVIKFQLFVEHNMNLDHNKVGTIELKNIKEGSKLFELHQQLKATLGSGDLRYIYIVTVRPLQTTTELMIKSNTFL